MALLAAVVLWRVRAQVSLTQWVEHSDEVLLTAKDAQLQFGDMWVAFGSYLVSPDQADLAGLRTSKVAFERKLEQITRLVADDAQQQRRWATVIETYVPGKFAELMKERDRGTLRPDSVAEAQAYHQQLTDALGEFIAAEYAIREQRTTHRRILDEALILLVPLLCALIAIVLAYGGWREITRASEQFAEALAKAEEANRAKDNFLAAISHELRNPLSSMMLLTNILLHDQGLPESARRRLEGIDRAAHTQVQLIEDLLEISRIESGRMRLDVQLTDLAQVVKAAVDSFKLAAQAKSITLQDAIDREVGLITGDPKRLQQVVGNLISNAIKFTPAGGRIEVRLQRINSNAEIIVSDNGQGIDASALPNMFDRYWRATESSGGRSGSGLGLSIVKELVGLHGGSVTVHSDGVGKGSTFTVRLPLPPATARLSEHRLNLTASPADGETAASRLDGVSLLVVDDDPVACDALTNALSLLGATVSAQPSARAALAESDRNHHDAIIADLEMPIEDGFFLAHEIRKREQERSAGHVTLLALASDDLVEDEVKILASGFDGRVAKPINLAELSSTIRSLLANRASAV